LKGGAYKDKGSGDVADKYQIPDYRMPKNDPMIPQEQKRIFAQNKADKPPYKPRGPDPVLNLQLYQQKPIPKKKPEAYPHPAVFYPNYVPNPFNPIEYANFMHYTRGYAPGGPVGGPIFKEYNININGVSGSHVKTSMLFEDALPMKQIGGSFTNLGERTTMYEYIRSIMFSKGDGEDLAIDDSNYNLLSHLKFMDMNPYNASRFSRNPYRGLPYGFLIFRSCYPIRHDERSASAICARNSTGINVRIYRMTEGAYKVNRTTQKVEDYDQWREMAFYDYIKDQIIKPKISPNFMIMYGYNITLDSKIDFESVNSIDKMRSHHKDYLDQAQKMSAMSANPSSVMRNKVIADLKKSNREEAEKKRFERVRQPVPGDMGGYPLAGRTEDPRYAPRYVPINHPTDQPHPDDGMIEETRKKIEKELNTYRGKALVCLTEAPNYSLMGWAKKEYRADGNIKRMINTGYHPAPVWESVLFQLMAALYVMQIKGIVIRNFRLDRNVFVKDIESHSKATTYWRYRIEGIDYYVPNYGYLLMIDTNYRDFDNDIDCDKEADPDRVRKLDGRFVNTSMLPAEITNAIFEMFREVMSPNTFDRDFVNDDGIKPPAEILQLMSRIKKDADRKEKVMISDYIRTHMTMFLHNRVGSLLAGDEPQKLMEGAVREFKPGELAVMKDRDNSDRFVIYVMSGDGADGDRDVARIITKDGMDDKANVIEKNVPVSSLMKYSTANPPDQTFDPQKSSLNDEPIETYVISAN
jgi:hypothetical protein